MLLTELLSPERVRIPFEATERDAVVRELVNLLAADGGVTDADQVYRAVMEREAVLSTGIGHGVAIPHGKSRAATELSMAVGVTSTPVPFDALDGEPVRLVFLLVGPESAAGPHIKALSRISRLVREPSIRERLLSAESAEGFLDALREAEGA